MNLKNLFIIIFLSYSVFANNCLGTKSLFNAEKDTDRLKYLIAQLYKEKIYPVVNGQTLVLLSSADEVMKRITNNSLIQNEQDALMILERRLQAARGKLTGLEAEQAMNLYNAVFQKKSSDKLTRKINMVIFRGGRGAGAFTKLLKDIKTSQNDPLISIQIVLGATDDGRSWDQAGKKLNLTGVPDIGKSLLDLANNKALIELFSYRFSKEEVMKLVGQYEPGPANVYQGLRYMKAKEPKSKDHLKELVNSLNNEDNDEYRSFMQHPRPYSLDDPRDVMFLQAIFEKFSSKDGSINIEDYVENAKNEFDLEQRILKNEINKKGFLGKLIKRLNLEREISKEDLKELNKLFEIFKKTIKNFKDENGKVDFQLHELPLRSAFLLGAKLEYGDWQKGIDKLGSLLKLNPGNRVLVATSKRYHLIGLLRDGTFFETEDDINEVKKKCEFEHIYLTENFPGKEKIKNINSLKTLEEKKAYITKHLLPDKIEVSQDAVSAIMNSDIKICMPTTLESNIGSALIVPKIAEALLRGRGMRVVVPNAIVENDPPETDVLTYLERIVRYTLNKPLSNGSLDTEDYQKCIDFSIGREKGFMDSEFHSTLMENNYEEIRKKSGILAFGVGGIGKFDEKTPENFGMYHEIPLVDYILSLVGIDQAGFTFDINGKISLKNQNSHSRFVLVRQTEISS